MKYILTYTSKIAIATGKIYAELPEGEYKHGFYEGVKEAMIAIQNSSQSDSDPCSEGWSDELQNLTINTLSDIDRIAVWHLLPNKSGVLKNIDGKFGFMKAADAIAQRWVITLENGETVIFASITDLVKAGWVVD